jgi:hypothetical protein
VRWQTVRLSDTLMKLFVNSIRDKRTFVSAGVIVNQPGQCGFNAAVLVRDPDCRHRLYCLTILDLCNFCPMSSVRLVLLGALLLLGPATLRAQANLPEMPEANPARPTVSTPATLTPVGYLQFENGGLYATNSPEFSKRLGINQVSKLTLNNRVELLALFEPFTHSTGAAVSGNRPGEVFTGMQAVILPGKDERPTISGQYLRRLYASPAPELDLGTFVQSATILLSDNLGQFHFDVNGLVLEQQDDKTKVRRAQFAQTLSISHPIGKLTVSGEIWHFAQPLTHGYAVGNLWSASYPVHKNLVIDAGFDHGLTATSTRWESFGGFTYVLPQRLWRQRR